MAGPWQRPGYGSVVQDAAAMTSLSNEFLRRSPGLTSCTGNNQDMLEAPQVSHCLFNISHYFPAIDEQHWI